MRPNKYTYLLIQYNTPITPDITWIWSAITGKLDELDIFKKCVVDCIAWAIWACLWRLLHYEQRWVISGWVEQRTWQPLAAGHWLRWTLGQGQRARKPPGGELELEVESGDQLMMMGSSSVGSWRPERRHLPHSPSQIFILFYPPTPVSQSWSSSFTSLYFSWSSFHPPYKLKGG